MTMTNNHMKMLSIVLSILLLTTSSLVKAQEEDPACTGLLDYTYTTLYDNDPIVFQFKPCNCYYSMVTGGYTVECPMDYCTECAGNVCMRRQDIYEFASSTVSEPTKITERIVFAPGGAPPVLDDSVDANYTEVRTTMTTVADVETCNVQLFDDAGGEEQACSCSLERCGRVSTSTIYDCDTVGIWGHCNAIRDTIVVDDEITDDTPLIALTTPFVDCFEPPPEYLTAAPSRAPTTAAPTTAMPTEAPTTATPTTARPTNAPTTLRPTTSKPTTAMPTNTDMPTVNNNVVTTTVNPNTTMAMNMTMEETTNEEDDANDLMDSDTMGSLISMIVDKKKSGGGRSLLPDEMMEEEQPTEALMSLATTARGSMMIMMTPYYLCILSWLMSKVC